jgi:hypothetical protein
MKTVNSLSARNPKKESILARFDNLKPATLSETFKFKTPGDAIFAKYLGRRLNVQGKNMTESANILDVEILQSTVNDDEEGDAGKHGIFESTGITAIMDGANLKEGDVFYLRFDSVDKKSRFKRFAFKKLSETEAIELEKELDDIPH